MEGKRERVRVCVCVLVYPCDAHACICVSVLVCLLQLCSLQLEGFLFSEANAYQRGNRCCEDDVARL